MMLASRGGYLGEGDWGRRSPQKQLRWGRPVHPSTNILRSCVVGCARKYERNQKGVIKEFFSEIVVVLVRKGSYRPTTFNIVKEPAWSKKRHSEILVREQFSVPPKLGARSPPLPISIKFDAVNSIYFYQDNVYCNHINCNSSNISRSIPSTIMVTTLIPDGRLFNCPLP